MGEGRERMWGKAGRGCSPSKCLWGTPFFPRLSDHLFSGAEVGSRDGGAKRYKICRGTAPAMWQGPTTRLLWALLNGAMTHFKV